MPAVIGKPPPPTRPGLVPRRIALAVQPELDRRVIPARVTLDSNAPPFAGELREEQTGSKVDIPIGAFVTLATLRRPWLWVGYAVDLGDANGLMGFISFLRILGRGVNGALGTSAGNLNSNGVLAFGAFNIAASAELVVANETEQVIHGVRGTIWGMGER